MKPILLKLAKSESVTVGQETTSFDFFRDEKTGFFIGYQTLFDAGTDATKKSLLLGYFDKEKNVVFAKMKNFDLPQLDFVQFYRNQNARSQELTFFSPGREFSMEYPNSGILSSSIIIPQKEPWSDIYKINDTSFDRDVYANQDIMSCARLQIWWTPTGHEGYSVMIFGFDYRMETGE
jgi:hypothetical protein